MFLELFKTKKPIMAMLHLKGNTREERLEICLREADIYAENGVDSMIVENYFSRDPAEVEACLKMLAAKRPQYLLGVNVLDRFELSWKLAEEYGAKYIQADSVSGHLRLEDDGPFAEMVERYRSRGGIAVIGGVRFKYQPILSGRSLEEDLRLGMQRCDAIAVTGTGTGRDTSSDKIKEFRGIMGDYPLVVAAGMLPETVEEKLSIGDAAIVGSTFKDTGKDTGDVSAEKVKAFMDRVRALRAAL